MTQSARELLERAMKLTPEERVRLADEIYASVDPELDAAWRAEIERRIEDARREGASYPTWEEALDRAEQRLNERRRARGE